MPVTAQHPHDETGIGADYYLTPQRSRQFGDLLHRGGPNWSPSPIGTLSDCVSMGSAFHAPLASPQADSLCLSLASASAARKQVSRHSTCSQEASHKLKERELLKAISSVSALRQTGASSSELDSALDSALGLAELSQLQSLEGPTENWTVPPDEGVVLQLRLCGCGKGLQMQLAGNRPRPSRSGFRGVRHSRSGFRQSTLRRSVSATGLSRQERSEQQIWLSELQSTVSALRTRYLENILLAKPLGSRR